MFHLCRKLPVSISGAGGTRSKKHLGTKAYYLSAADNGSFMGYITSLCISRAASLGTPSFHYHSSAMAACFTSTSCAAASLIEAAERLAHDVGAQRIEMRQGSELSTAWTDRAPKVTMEVELPVTVQELSDRLSPKMRKRIRFARKNGLEPKWGRTGGAGRFLPRICDQYAKPWAHRSILEAGLRIFAAGSQTIFEYSPYSKMADQWHPHSFRFLEKRSNCRGLLRSPSLGTSFHPFSCIGRFLSGLSKTATSV